LLTTLSSFADKHFPILALDGHKTPSGGWEFMSAYQMVEIVGESGERIALRRTSNTTDGWFDTEVEIQCDGWRGKFTASVLQGELPAFAQKLRILHEKLEGEAALIPIEPNLEVSFIGDGKGHIEVNGIARNQFHTGTKLSFHLDLDQTFLPAIIKGLEEIDRAAPNSQEF
jgi:hypothetical protein